MAKIGLVNSSVAGGLISGPGSPTVFVNGFKVSLDQDFVTPHGVGLHALPQVIATNNTTYTISGKRVVVEGDLATCGHSVISFNTVFIG